MTTKVRSRIRLMGGPMGTQLLEKTGRPCDCCDMLNLDAPSVVEEVICSQIESGAEIVLTNTFQSTYPGLGVDVTDSIVDRVNKKGVMIARDASARVYGFVNEGAVEICGMIGPLGPCVKDAEAAMAYRLQIDSLVEAGVDSLLADTVISVGGADMIIRAVSGKFDIPLYVSATLRDDGRMFDGNGMDSLVGIVRDAEESGITVGGIGINCVYPPAAGLDALCQLAEECSWPLMFRPSVADPANPDKRAGDMELRDAFCRAKSIVEERELILGVCCGGTPGHIEMLKSI